MGVRFRAYVLGPPAGTCHNILCSAKQQATVATISGTINVFNGRLIFEEKIVCVPFRFPIVCAAIQFICAGQCTTHMLMFVKNGQCVWHVYHIQSQISQMNEYDEFKAIVFWATFFANASWEGKTTRLHAIQLIFQQWKQLADEASKRANERA